MKTCARCGDSKHASEFNRSARNSDALHSYCRDCQKSHYLANRGTHMANVRRASAARKTLIREFLAGAMSGGCVDCGNADLRVLEFDHVRGVKLAGVSQLYRAGRKLEVIRDEVAKCDVRCRNCHAIVTAERRGISWFDAYA